MSKHKDFLKTLNLNDTKDWDLVKDDVLLLSDLLSFNLFPHEKLNDIPLKFFESPLFCLKMFSYYTPPIDKINPKFFEDENFLIEIASKHPYNIKHIPLQHITPKLIKWYIDVHSNQKEYIKYIPLSQIDEECAIKILDRNTKDYSYIAKKFTNLSFYQSLSERVISSIYQKLPADIKSNFDILKKSISLNPSNYSFAPESFYNPNDFKQLIDINPLVYKHAPTSLKDDFECAFLAVSKDISNLEYLGKLKFDLEFFIVCHNSFSTQLSGYYYCFGQKIFSDTACVNLILDNLIENDNIHLLVEPVISNPEIMFKTIKFMPKNYQYIGEKLIEDTEFFNSIQYSLKNLSSQFPTKYIWADMHEELIQNIPQDSLNSVPFLHNLFLSNKDNFLLHVYPLIVNSNAPLILDINNLKLTNVEQFSEFFSRFEHQKELIQKINDLDLLKKDKIHKKI